MPTKKVIEVGEGKFAIKSYAEDGSSLGTSSETYNSEADAQAVIDSEGSEVTGTAKSSEPEEEKTADTDTEKPEGNGEKVE